ncbi:hypothetical protein C6P45_003777 [Maudiozyma exigua]|uniref:Uncharacterized protein n=1 Tax=Maudiozyma exigua TaxID=34358 RepID=A0A9P7BC28_MAUEX|nr:hypothetical protein C6P45_003777 [Kazachstania exigua]
MPLLLRRTLTPKIYDAAKYLPVTVNDKITTSPKGICGPVLKYKNMFQLHEKRASVFSGDFISLKYYPPDHFVSLFRKTSPAFTAKSSISKSFIDSAGPYIQNHYSKKKSAIPINYAVWRRKLKLLVQVPFFEKWTALDGQRGVKRYVESKKEIGVPIVESYERSMPQGVAKDGYYEFLILKYPNNENDNIALQNEVRRSVEIVANLDWGKFLNERLPRLNINPKYIHKVIPKKRIPNTWMETANKKINFGLLNRFLMHANLPLRLIRAKKVKPSKRITRE